MVLFGIICHFVIKLSAPVNNHWSTIILDFAFKVQYFDINIIIRCVIVHEAFCLTKVEIVQDRTKLQRYKLSMHL